jgi:hypothetical protein
MTLPYNPQGEDPLTTSTRVELFDVNGRVDATASIAATKEVQSDVNTVRLPNGTVDVVNTQAKRLAAKAAVLARRT